MSKAHLELRSEVGVDGTRAVQIVIAHKGDKIRIGTGDRVRAADWERRGPSALVAGKLTKVQTALDTLSYSGEIYSMDRDDIKKACEGALCIIRERVSRAGEFKRHAEDFIGRHSAPKTRKAYNYTLSVLERSERLAGLRFKDITYKWLVDLEAWMANAGMKVNTIRHHMVNIRAIVSDAVKCGVTDTYAFRQYRVKHEETRKRCLDGVDIRRLRDLKIDDPVKAMYRDLWMLSFYMIGINAADLIGATPDQVVKGRFEYRRSKTGKLISVKIPPEAQRIMDRYKGEHLLLSCAEDYEHPEQFCRRWRDGLATLGTGSVRGKKGTKPAAFPGLTPYWARHSWATLAHRCGVSLDVIARALGHSWAVVTDIYIRFDDSKVDEANRMVIDSLK